MRVGILSGLFDPIHDGHVQLALAAAKAAQLDTVYFLVEGNPRRKSGVTHQAHRIAMVKRAIAKQPKLQLLELPDRQFSVARTLPRLQQKFKDDSLVLIAGSDWLEHMPSWPLVHRLLEQTSLVLARRGKTTSKTIKEGLAALPTNPSGLWIISSPKPNLSSKKIRTSLMAGRQARGLDKDVRSYIKQHWLYVLPSSSASSSSLSGNSDS